MPFDGSGNFTRLYSWQSDRDNNIKILASRMDAEFDNYAQGMNQVFFRNGIVPMSGNLNVGSNYIVGLGAGSAAALPLRFADDSASGLYLDGVGKPTIAVAGAKRLQVNNTGAAVIGVLTADSLNISGTGTFLNMASGSVTTNGLNLLGNATITGTLNAGGAITGASIAVNSVTSNGLTVFGAGSFSGALNAGGAITQAGNQVWHAGNLAPGNYATLSGANFTGPLLQNGNQVYHTGNLSLAGYAQLTGANFTGAIVSSGNISSGSGSVQSALGASGNVYSATSATTGALLFGSAGTKYLLYDGSNYVFNTNPVFAAGGMFIDAQYYKAISGGNPVLNFDNGDALIYDRSANTLRMLVGGTAVWSVDASGNMKTRGDITAFATSI